MRTNDLSREIQLSASNNPTRCFLRTSRNAAAPATGEGSSGITLSDKGEAALLNLIPVNGRLCAWKLQIRLASEMLVVLSAGCLLSRHTFQQTVAPTS